MIHDNILEFTGKPYLFVSPEQEATLMFNTGWDVDEWNLIAKSCPKMPRAIKRDSIEQDKQG